MKKSGIVDTLKNDSAGLLMPSETDASFDAFSWEGETGKPEKARVLELAGLPAGTPVKVKSVDTFFKDATQEHDWQDDEEKAQVEKFKQLVATLKSKLADVKVFQAGKVEADVFIVGRTDSGWAGLKTKVVET
jgi:nuclease A inhibitor-like protein